METLTPGKEILEVLVRPKFVGITEDEVLEHPLFKDPNRFMSALRSLTNDEILEHMETAEDPSCGDTMAYLDGAAEFWTSVLAACFHSKKTDFKETLLFAGWLKKLNREKKRSFFTKFDIDDSWLLDDIYNKNVVERYKDFERISIMLDLVGGGDIHMLRLITGILIDHGGWIPRITMRRINRYLKVAGQYAADQIIDFIDNSEIEQETSDLRCFLFEALAHTAQCLNDRDRYTT